MITSIRNERDLFSGTLRESFDWWVSLAGRTFDLMGLKTCKHQSLTSVSQVLNYNLAFRRTSAHEMLRPIHLNSNCNWQKRAMTVETEGKIGSNWPNWDLIKISHSENCFLHLIFSWKRRNNLFQRISFEINQGNRLGLVQSLIFFVLASKETCKLNVWCISPNVEVVLAACLSGTLYLER